MVIHLARNKLCIIYIVKHTIECDAVVASFLLSKMWPSIGRRHGSQRRWTDRSAGIQGRMAGAYVWTRRSNEMRLHGKSGTNR